MKRIILIISICFISDLVTAQNLDLENFPIFEISRIIKKSEPYEMEGYTLQNRIYVLHWNIINCDSVKLKIKPIPYNIGSNSINVSKYVLNGDTIKIPRYWEEGKLSERRKFFLGNDSNTIKYDTIINRLCQDSIEFLNYGDFILYTYKNGKEFRKSMIVENRTRFCAKCGGNMYGWINQESISLDQCNVHCEGSRIKKKFEDNELVNKIRNYLFAKGLNCKQTEFRNAFIFESIDIYKNELNDGIQKELLDIKEPYIQITYCIRLEINQENFCLGVKSATSKVFPLSNYKELETTEHQDIAIYLSNELLNDLIKELK